MEVTIPEWPPQPNKLDACVRHIHESEGIPAFCKRVSDIMVRTLDIESNSRLPIAKAFRKKSTR